MRSLVRRAHSGHHDESPPERPSILEWAALALVLLFVLLLAVVGVKRGHISNGDSSMVVRGASKILECAANGTWRECHGQAEVGPFPLLQYLPALVVTFLRIDETGILRGLAALNLLVLVGILAALWITFWKRRDWGWLALGSGAFVGTAFRFDPPLSPLDTMPATGA